MNPPLVITETEAAAYTGFSRYQLRKWRRAGLLKPLAIEGVYVWYRRGDLEEFVAEMEVRTDGAQG